MSKVNKTYDVIIVGAGPMGIATAIEAKKAGLKTLILEKGVLVNSLYHFPDQMIFFSTSRRLEIGNVPFMSTKEKPSRDEALEYYRRVIEFWDIKVNTYEAVSTIDKREGVFYVTTPKACYQSSYVVVSTGFYSTINPLNVPGDDLQKVSHYYNNAHPYIGKKVAVIGAANSAAQVALDLFHKGVEVTMVVRDNAIKPTVKYWIRPNIENRIKEGSVKAYFNSTMQAIKKDSVIIEQNGEIVEFENDFVLAMIGYRPDYDFLNKVGINNCDDIYKTPQYDTRQQTNIENLYLAGVVCGGLKTNRFMIEDSIIHAEEIIKDILKKISK